MSPITTHILDIAAGRPAAGIPVVLEQKSHAAGWQLVAEGMSDSDGRVNDLFGPGDVFLTGHYRLTFDTSTYFLNIGVECFFPQVMITFVVKDEEQHFHVPLLLSRYGYTTYRGS
ncbi:MAG: hydroxyisourate hydrolase [Pyrinomonadaceae bacterium]